MPTITRSAPLCRLEECPHLMVDGCICDEQRDLIFLSLWGRDTAVQEFLARLTLGPNERGLDRLNLLSEQTPTIEVFIGNVERLQKCTTRTFRRTRFGSLIHLWLFDKRCVHPDKANASALVALPKEASNCTERLWSLVKETCPLPLLDHWRDTVLKLLHSQEMLSSLPFTIGPLQGYRLAIDVPVLTQALGEMIRSHRLGVAQNDVESDTRLERVA